MPVVTKKQSVAAAVDPASRIVEVRYIGKGNTYTYARPRDKEGKSSAVKFVSPRKGGQPMKVTLADWNHLRKQRNPDGQREFALVGGLDKELIAQDRARSRVGEFVTKRAAMEFAADKFNVQLIATLTLEQMNAMSAILQQRASAGWSVDQMVDGLKGAYPLEVEDSDEVYVEPPISTAPVAAEDDDDEIKQLLAQEPEPDDGVTYDETDKQPPPPSTRQVPKPAPRVREMP